MSVFVALVRTVNVGGTDKLPMSELRAICESIGFEKPYIQSDNVVFRSELTSNFASQALEEQLRDRFGKPASVIVRDADELCDVLERNPFPKAEPNRVPVLFHDGNLSSAASTAKGLAGKAGTTRDVHTLSLRYAYELA